MAGSQPSSQNSQILGIDGKKEDILLITWLFPHGLPGHGLVGGLDIGRWGCGGQGGDAKEAGGNDGEVHVGLLVWLVVVVVTER